MKSFIFFLTLCMAGSLQAQYTYAHLDVKYSFTETELKKYTYGNLRLYPVWAKQSFTDTFRTVGRYMNLKEALAKGKVIITEQLGGASVNTLTIENISADTVLIMAGEVITGGKQNRIIGKDILLMPKSGKIDLSVYCVEAGRWENVSTGTNQFNNYFSVGSLSLRKTVEKSADQGEVWKKVDDLNKANSTGSRTKTYTAITQSDKFNEQQKAYTGFFKNRFANEKNIIGVIVVSGDKVLGCDMFATPDLFRSNFENLLTSYVTEAIISGKTVTASPEKVKSYMDKLLRSEAEQAATIKEKGKVFTAGGKKMRVSSYD
jgi:hypothetical protein